MSHLEHIGNHPLVIMLGDGGKLTYSRTVKFISETGVMPDHIAMTRKVKGFTYVFLTYPYSDRFQHVILPSGNIYYLTETNGWNDPLDLLEIDRDFWLGLYELMIPNET
jgi:hypothetical protein